MNGNYYRVIYIFNVILVVLPSQVQGATINDTETLLTNLLTNYNKRVRPINNQSQAIHVGIKMYIKSIQDFDEVQEKFSFVGAMSVEWNDYKMQWDPTQYGGLINTTVGYSDIWLPELVLSSPSGKAISVGKSTDVIRISDDGSVFWFPKDLIQSTCSVNVRTYPFDVQKCTTSFASLGYMNYEVLLVNSEDTIDFSVYSENSLWKIDGSEVKTKLLIAGNSEMEIDFSVYLRRKSAYVVINVLMPILVLSLMNAWVFLLVTESGERIGYTLTTLLAIAVYMTIVSDTLPRSSEPVPLISYKLMSDLIASALTAFVAILNIRIYSREDDLAIPKWLLRLYLFLTCVCCFCKTKRITPEKKECEDHFVSVETEMNRSEENENIRKDKTGLEDNFVSMETEMKLPEEMENIRKDNTGLEDNFVSMDTEMKYPVKVENNHSDKTGYGKIKTRQEDAVTWKSISIMFDWVALIGFSTFSVLSFVIFLVITTSSHV